jgi:hypothetical protein
MAAPFHLHLSINLKMDFESENVSNFRKSASNCDVTYKVPIDLPLLGIGLEFKNFS